jgi:16S rRNA (guanine(1405)-N(7))-methyltransferase
MTSGEDMLTEVPSVGAVSARLRAAAKYRDVHPDTIADVVRFEHDLASGRIEPAELERRARARLHKVAALHLLTAKVTALGKALDGVEPEGDAGLRTLCRQLLGAHMSTAERLPDLDRFYPAILDLVPAPRTIADIACALNVFALPWLREVSDARYLGYDLNAAFVRLGRAFVEAHYPDCGVVHADVLTGDVPPADLALLLKTYHCIENRRKGAGLNLVDRLAARHVVVSFPTRALNGRAAVFAQRHVEQLTEVAGQRGWGVARVTLTSEDLLVIDKPDL